MNGERLLLVEDDATTREVLTLLLEADGWTAETAPSGEIALEKLRTNQAAPDLVLSDLHLPGIQGSALADAVRRVVPTAGCFGMSASEPSAADLAAYQTILRKPLQPSELREAWDRWKAGNVTDTPSVGMLQTDESASGVREDLPVIAPATLLKLEQQMGTRAKDLYAFALADAGDRLRRMEASLAGGDQSSLHKEAHALKGSAGMIGAERLAALAAGAETTSVRSFPGSLSETLRHMHLACEEIRLMLETLFPM
jgi:CheY-like chemotaxis protein